MKIKLLASILVIFSGILLVLDVILDKAGIEIENKFGFKDSTNFIFYTSQWLSIILLIFVSKLKPYAFSYFSPIYGVVISGYWLLFTRDYDTKDLFYFSVLGISLLVLLLFMLVWRFFEKEKLQIQENESKGKMFESFFDLSSLISKNQNK